jgi:hypothetical protein
MSNEEGQAVSALVSALLRLGRDDLPALAEATAELAEIHRHFS